MSEQKELFATDEPCRFCGQPAEILCDYVLGWGAKVDETGPEPRFVADQDRMFTCDAAVCRDHAKVTGHMCGEECDTTDLCLAHIGKPSSGLKLLTDLGAAQARGFIALVPEEK